MEIDFRSKVQAERGDLVPIADRVTQGLDNDRRETKTGLTECQWY